MTGSSQRTPTARCTCDPDQESINDPERPTHGAEIRVWQVWERGESRCPYCVNTAWENFVAICDCWRADEALLAGWGGIEGWPS